MPSAGNCSTKVPPWPYVAACTAPYSGIVWEPPLRHTVLAAWLPPVGAHACFVANVLVVYKFESLATWSHKRPNSPAQSRIRSDRKSTTACSRGNTASHLCSASLYVNTPTNASEP